MLDDGTLIATIFNKPSHGKHEGDVECWASTDGGRLWKLRGVAAPHEAGTTRMNVAAGLAHDGSLVVIASGWGGKGLRERVLRPWICRSSDGGRTWARSGQIQFPAGVETMIPFGDVIQGRGKTLAAALYGWAVDSKTGKPLRGRHSYMLFSNDDGYSWGDAVILGPDDYNETSLLALGPSRWLAAVRTYKARNLELFSSADQGRTWKRGGPLTMPSHHPAHLLRLNDGRVLLTYGIREKNHQGIGRRISDDGGRTWGAPTRIVDLPGTTDQRLSGDGAARGRNACDGLLQQRDSAAPPLSHGRGSLAAGGLASGPTQPTCLARYSRPNQEAQPFRPLR